MPIIHIEAFEGRTVEQKRRLAKAVTDAVSEVYETSPDAVRIIFRDMKQEDFAKAGKLYIDLK